MLLFKSIKREITAPALKHIAGIDQLRYVFAIWVFFAHGGGPPFFAGHANTSLFNFIERLYGWSINGQAAVMGFFIVSGLCIHYPNIRRDTFNIKAFYTARFLRLSLPLIVCLAIAKLLNYHHPDGFLRIVPMWSLYCEAAYYIIYPFILWIVKKGYLVHLIFVSGCTSFILIIIWASERSMYFHEIGGGDFLYWKVALLAFPCWLLGVLMGEEISNSSKTNNVIDRKGSLLYWRIGAFILSAIVFPLYRIGLYFKLTTLPFSGLVFSSQITILLFTVYAFFWIKKEVLYHNFGDTKPSKLLERFGLASYTLYLVHTLILWLFDGLSSRFSPGYLFFWIILVLALHCSVFIFYSLIEKPSHKFAKICAAYLRD